jgi:hypothetical protein
MFLVLFIYAVLGMNFFGLMRTDLADTPFGVYSDQVNLKHFGISIVTLYQIHTTDYWNAVMHDVMRTVSPYAWVYFVSFMILVYYLLLNMVIALIVDQFASMMRQEKQLVKPEQIKEYATLWSKFDPNATQLMDITRVQVFLKYLPPPLGFNDLDGVARIRAYDEVNFGSDEFGRVHFVELFIALVKYAFSQRQTDTPPERIAMQLDLMREALLEEAEAIFPSVATQRVPDLPFAVLYSAMKLQSRIKARIQRRKDREKAEAEAAAAGGVGVEEAKPEKG